MAHIRKPSRRSFRTSSSGYVRRSLKTMAPETLCGAPVTDRDTDARGWRKAQRFGDAVCPDCIEAAAS